MAIARILAAISVMGWLVACVGVPKEPLEGHPDVLRVSAKPAPDWINKLEPNASQGFVYFVGRSSGTASERTAFDQTRQDVVDQVLLYLGAFAERDFEERRLSLNLESQTLDPTVAAKDFRDFASKNFVSQIRATETYWEYRRTPGGDQYFGYSLIPFPVNQSMRGFADQQVADAQRLVREAQTDEAKRQAQDVVEFWEQTKSVFGGGP